MVPVPATVPVKLYFWLRPRLSGPGPELVPHISIRGVNLSLLCTINIKKNFSVIRKSKKTECNKRVHVIIMSTIFDFLFIYYNKGKNREKFCGRTKHSLIIKLCTCKQLSCVGLVVKLFVNVINCSYLISS